jgi:PmbA protein
MNTKEKFALADLVVEHALKGGAKQVSVVIQDNRSTNIEIRDQKIDSLKESNRNSLNISLYVDNKYSSHSTNRLKKEELFKFVDEAIIATKYLAEDEFRSLPDPELYYKGDGADLNTYDAKLDTVDVKTKIDLANQALNEAYKKDDRIISVSSYYNDSISHKVLVSSNGFSGEDGNSNLSLSVSVSMKSDTGRPSDYWYENAIFFDKLKSTEIGKKALTRTINKIGPKKIESGKYAVIIENRVAGNICGPIFQALQGYSLYQKQSFLIGKENKPIASPLLTVTDDPLLPSDFGSRLFDEEGLMAYKRPIIEKGVLKSFYIDNYYGKKLGVKPTSGSSSNVIINAGSRSKEDMINSMKKGVFITGFIGGNCNGSTGDFSYGIEGFLIKDGKIVHPVNEMNISGNMNQFWFNLAELGNDILDNQSFKSPSMLFDNVDLSGT